MNIRSMLYFQNSRFEVVKSVSEVELSALNAIQNVSRFATV